VFWKALEISYRDFFWEKIALTPCTYIFNDIFLCEYKYIIKLNKNRFTDCARYVDKIDRFLFSNQEGSTT